MDMKQRIARLEAAVGAAPAPKKPIPSVGRIVHYWPTTEQTDEDGSGPWPAIILSVPAADSDDELVGSAVVLQAIDPKGMSHTMTLVAQEEKPDVPGTWCWPPRV